MKKNKKTTLLVISIITVLVLFFSALTTETPPPATTETENSTFLTSETIETDFPSHNIEETPDSSSAAPSTTTKPAITQSVGTGKEEILSLSEIPPYSGSPFVVLQNNVPNFSASELKTIGYESYSPLDSLGRTGKAIASVGKDTMPKAGEKRGSISSIRPTGWVQAQYDHISGKYLYNRCHLIGWQLSAENANPRNLITGTKYLNVSGMLPFENMVADYIKETGNHVAYRITPIYEGTNLLPYGVEMEAYSVEDQGDGISFHIFCYNIEPGVTLNYKDGSSSLTQSAPVITTAAPTTTTQAPTTTTTSTTQTVFITKSGKKYHSTKACRGLNNANAIFESSLLDAKNKNLTPCSICY